MKNLDNPTVGPVHLQLFRPSVIRGPWIKPPLGEDRNLSFPQKLICPIVIFRYRFPPVDLFMNSVMHGLAVVNWSMVISETYTSRRIVQDIERLIHFFLTRICSYHAIQTRAAEMSKILMGTI